MKTWQATTHLHNHLEILKEKTIWWALSQFLVLKAPYNFKKNGFSQQTCLFFPGKLGFWFSLFSLSISEIRLQLWNEDLWCHYKVNSSSLQGELGSLCNKVHKIKQVKQINILTCLDTVWNDLLANHDNDHLNGELKHASIRWAAWNESYYDLAWTFETRYKWLKYL